MEPNPYFVPNPALVAANTAQNKIVQQQAETQALETALANPMPVQQDGLGFAPQDAAMMPQEAAMGLGML